MTIYLDHAASTPLRTSVYHHLLQSLKDDVANPQSAHALGRAADERIEACRAQLLQLLGAEADDQFIFTSSATESNNTVISSLLKQANCSAVYSLADHASVVAPIQYYCQQGATCYPLPMTKNLDIDLSALETLVQDKKPNLLVLTHVNSISGHVADVIAIAKRVKQLQPGVHIHVDAAQGFAKFPINLQHRVIDSLSISAHKIGGPVGVSGLYMKNNIAIDPLLLGGGQEHGMRSSTPAVSLIEAFSLAATEAINELPSSADVVTQLSAEVHNTLHQAMPNLYFPFAAAQQVSPYILSLFVPNIPSDVIVRHLEQQGIMVSSRSACSSKKQGPSVELTALGVAPEWHQNGLRISFAPTSTIAEVKHFCETFLSTVNLLQQLHSD